MLDRLPIQFVPRLDDWLGYFATGGLKIRPERSLSAPAIRMDRSASVIRGSVPPLRPGMPLRGRSDVAYSKLTHSLHVAKSRAFFMASGYRSKRGIITVTSSFNLCTSQQICGFVLGRRALAAGLNIRNEPAPTRLAMARRPSSSSALMLMANLALKFLCEMCFEKLKQPSPSTRPERYHPKASSVIRSIGCDAFINKQPAALARKDENSTPLRVAIIPATRRNERLAA